MSFKVLWCDRNYDYVESFIEATKTMLPDVEFVIKNEPVDAIKEILTHKQDYQLIISGQVFKNMTGTDLFEIVFNNKVQIPFLLLTAQADYSQFNHYDLWYSFSYLDKFKADFYEVAEKIKELFSRDISATFMVHQKLKELRLSIGLTPKEMAALVGATENDVIASESDYQKVISSYVVLVCQKFNFPIQTLVQTNLDYFKNSIIPKSIEIDQDKIKFRF